MISQNDPTKRRRLNILHITLNNVGHGTYWRSLMFGKWLVETGHQVTIIATSKTEKTKLKISQIDGVRLIESPDIFSGSLRSGWDLYNSFRRSLWLRGKRFDLVHAFESRPTVIIPAIYMHKIRNIPLVMDWADWFGRGGSVEERNSRILRAVLTPVETFFEEFYRKKADASTVICSSLLEKSLQLGVPKEKINLLPNGSDPERFYPTNRRKAREEINLSKEGFYIGYAGSIYHRDAILLANAFDLVAKATPNIHLIIAGNCPIDIQKLSRFPDRITQTGPLKHEQMRLNLSACDLFWLPMKDTNTNRGRFPLKINDYIAMERPIIATAVGDVKDIFAKDSIGKLAFDTPEDVAKQTINLIHDPSSRDRMGKHARWLSENEYHWKNRTKKLMEIYEHVLN